MTSESAIEESREAVKHRLLLIFAMKIGQLIMRIGFKIMMLAHDIDVDLYKMAARTARVNTDLKDPISIGERRCAKMAILAIMYVPPTSVVDNPPE